MSSDRKDPVTPSISDRDREEMWLVISRSWTEQAARHRAIRSRPLRVAFAGFGIAAALVAGVMIGRWSIEADEDVLYVRTLVDEPELGRPLTAPYRIAVNNHFRDTETLLALFESSDAADIDIADRARELAAASRLLMDSDAGRDAEIRAVLDELELLLLQISQLRDANATELEIIRAGVEETSALDRMRLLMAENPGTLAL